MQDCLQTNPYENSINTQNGAEGLLNCHENWLLWAKFTYSPFTMVIEDNKILKRMQEGTSKIL